MSAEIRLYISVPVRVCNIVAFSFSSALRNAEKFPWASRTARVNCSYVSPTSCGTILLCSVADSGRCSPSERLWRSYDVGRKLPLGLFLVLEILQRTRYSLPSTAEKSTSAYPSVLPRRSIVLGSLSCKAALPKRSMALLFLMLSSLGELPYRAMHMASSMVVFPEPVLPVIANSPACFNGSRRKSISNSPDSEARFFPLIASIFMIQPPSLFRQAVLQDARASLFPSPFYIYPSSVQQGQFS